MNPSGQEQSVVGTAAIPDCGLHREDQDTPAEQAIVQHQRESGMLPRWVVNRLSAPGIIPRTEYILTLDGGLRIRFDDEYRYRIIYLALSLEASRFDYDAPLADIARELPARLLTCLEAATADLRKMVALQSPAGKQGGAEG